MSLKFEITADNTAFIRSLNQTRNAVNATMLAIKEQGGTAEHVINNLKQAAGALAAGFSAKAFINQIVRVRGEYQQLEVAFKTMLGNAEKAETLMQQLSKTAASTPFDLQSVTNGAKQLLAYGISADEVNDKLVHLGDIAAGLSIPLNDLVYLYGTTMVQGRMFTQDLRQFQNRGIPIAEELARVFGVTKDKVGELVTAGKVSAKEFNSAIMAMSSEGGKFAGLMESQSKTITGQISNIEDAIDVMFNNIGKQSEGIINSSLSVVSSLVENYEHVGKVIGGVVATYGTYKAAVMTVTALQGLQAAGIGALTTAESIHYGWLVLCEKAQKLLNATMLANPYVLVATAIAGLVVVMVTMKGEQERVNEAYAEYLHKKETILAKEAEHKARIEELTRVAGDESLSTDTRRMALIELEQKYPSIFAKYDTEAEKLKHIRDLKAEIVELDGKGSISKTANELAKVEKRIKELEKKGRATGETYTSTTGAVFFTQTGGRTADEDAELKALRKRRDKLRKQQKKDKNSTYLANLTAVTDAELKEQIEERRNILEKMNVGKWKYGKVQKGGVTGVFSKDELQGQMQMLQAEQLRRSKNLEDSTKDFVAETNKRYKEEQATLRKLKSLSDPKKRVASTMEVDGKKVSEMSGDEFLNAITKQQERVNEALKKADAYKIKGDDKANEDAAARRQKLFDLERRTSERVAARRQEQSDAQEDAEIAAITNDAEREIKEREIQHQRKLRQIQDQTEEWKKESYKAAEDRFNATNADKSKTFADTAEGKAGWQGQTLTPEQEAIIKAREAEENAIYERGVQERYKSELKSMTDHLKAYGSFQQQREAINAEYAQKIKDANGDVWQEASIKAEWEKQISEINLKELQAGLNWEEVFGNLDSYSTQYLNDIKDKLRTALDAKDITAENAKVLVEKIRELEDTISSRKDVWASILPGLRERKRLTEEAARAEKEYAEALDRENTARLNVLQGKESIQHALYEAGIQLDISQIDVDEASKQALLEKVDPSSDLYKALEDMLKNLGVEVSNLGKETDNVSNKKTGKERLNDLLKGKGTLTDIFSWAGTGNPVDIMNGINSNVQSLADLTDTLNLGETEFGEAVHNFAEGSQSFTNVTQDLMSGDVFGAINDTIKGVDAWGKMFGISILGGGTENFDAAVEKWGWLLDSWKDNLAYEKELMEKAYGADVLESQRKAEDMLTETIKAAKTTYDAWASDGGGLFSRSNRYKANENVKWDQINSAEIDAKVGNNIIDLFDLTGEELKTLKYESGEFWGSLDEKAQEYLNEVIEIYEEQENLADQANERLTNTSFDSVKSSFESMLNDLDSENKDFAEQFEKYLVSAVVNGMMMSKYEEQLETWYEGFAEKMKDGALSKSERDELKKEYDQITQSALTEREQLFSAVGIDTESLKSSSSSSTSDQSATASMTEKATYDQFETYLGIATAQQITTEQMRATGELVAANIATMTTLASSRNAIVGELRNLVSTGNEYLLDIKRSNRDILETVSDRMEETVKLLKEIV